MYIWYTDIPKQDKSKQVFCLLFHAKSATSFSLKEKFEAFSRICIASNIQFQFCKWDLFSLRLLDGVFPLALSIFAVNNDLTLSLLPLLTIDTKIFLSSFGRNYSVSHLVIISVNYFPWITTSQHFPTFHLYCIALFTHVKIRGKLQSGSGYCAHHKMNDLKVHQGLDIKKNFLHCKGDQEVERAV